VVVFFYVFFFPGREKNAGASNFSGIWPPPDTLLICLLFSVWMPELPPPPSSHLCPSLLVVPPLRRPPRYYSPETSVRVNSSTSSAPRFVALAGAAFSSVIFLFPGDIPFPNRYPLCRGPFFPARRRECLFHPQAWPAPSKTLFNFGPSPLNSSFWRSF